MSSTLMDRQYSAQHNPKAPNTNHPRHANFSTFPKVTSSVSQASSQFRLRSGLVEPSRSPPQPTRKSIKFESSPRAPQEPFKSSKNPLALPSLGAKASRWARRPQSRPLNRQRKPEARSAQHPQPVTRHETVNKLSSTAEHDSSFMARRGLDPGRGEKKHASGRHAPQTDQPHSRSSDGMWGFGQKVHHRVGRRAEGSNGKRIQRGYNALKASKSVSASSKRTHTPSLNKPFPTFGGNLHYASDNSSDDIFSYPVVSTHKRQALHVAPAESSYSSTCGLDDKFLVVSDTTIPSSTQGVPMPEAERPSNPNDRTHVPPSSLRRDYRLKEYPSKQTSANIEVSNPNRPSVESKRSVIQIHLPEVITEHATPERVFAALLVLVLLHDLNGRLGALLMVMFAVVMVGNEGRTSVTELLQSRGLSR